MNRRNRLEGELLPPADDYGRRSLVGPMPPIIHIRTGEGDLPAAQPDEPMLERELRRPTRAPSLESDVVVPGLQAGMTAIAVALGAAVLVYVQRWPGRYVALAFGVTLAIAWLWRLRVVDALLWQVERLIGRDITGDKQIGQPSGPVLVNPYEARQEARESAAAESSEAAREALIVFLHRCYISGCSEAAHHITASGPDRDEYVAHRDILLSLGIAQWRNPAKPKAGWKVIVSHQRALDLLSRHTL